MTLGMRLALSVIAMYENSVSGAKFVTTLSKVARRHCLMAMQACVTNEKRTYPYLTMYSKYCYYLELQLANTNTHHGCERRDYYSEIRFGECENSTKAVFLAPYS